MEVTSQTARFPLHNQPGPAPHIAGAAYDAADPSPNATFVVTFDRAMDQDGGDAPGNWTFHSPLGGTFPGTSLAWDDAMHLRVHTAPGLPSPPRTGDYTQTGGDVRSATGVELATVAGFGVA